jgi:hypothetical protein
MSLDVSLYGPPEDQECRECQQVRPVQSEVFWANTTHNLTAMAEAAGIYQCLWRPDENGITKASQLIEPLRKGLELLKAQPDHFRTYNPHNGWGSYDHFVPWVERYLRACEEYPDAEVKVCR